MKTLKIVLMITVVMLLIATTAGAGQAGVSFTERYSWHGFEVFGRDYVHPGISTSIQGIEVQSISHIGEASDDIEYWDTIVGYKLQTMFPIEITAGYGYFILPGVDAQEFNITASIPGTVRPRYTIAHIELDKAGRGEQLHIVGLDMDIGDRRLEAISATLSAEATYNEGVNPFGIEDIKGWTHATAGLILNVTITENLAIRPGVIYQHTFEREVSDDRNEVWAVAGMSWRF